ncbi:MAG: glycosyltransferase family 39 protein [Alphaproteobacteria bacterium]|nr:glycosyltransferase family 39 protein [Alphaproteobacteria bacterium]
MINRLRMGGTEHIVFWALIVLSFVLRVYKLDAPLWFDEIMTLIHYVRLPFDQLIADYSSFNNHLFYSLQAKAAVSAFGESAWVLRLPALIFGVGGVWALWRLARTTLGASESLLAAALLALSYHHIWFSQNARGYTELMFWCLAALVIFVEAIGSRSWRAWGMFGLVLAAAMYTHLTAAFFIAAMGLAYAGMLAATWLRLRISERFRAPTERTAQLAPLWGFIFGGVVTLILCAPAIPQMAALVGSVSQSSEVDLMQEYQNPLWTILEGIRTLGGSGGLMMIAIPAAILAGAVGFVGLLRRAPLIAVVGVLHVVLTLVALLVMNMRIWPRFFFTDIAFAFLFITHGLFICAGFFGRLAERIGWPAISPGRLFGVAAFATIGASVLLAIRNYDLPKQNFPGAVEIVGDAPADSVGAVGLAGEVYAPYLNTGWREIRTAEDLSTLTPFEGRRWAVVIFPSRTELERADVLSVLRRDFTLVQTLPGTLGDGEVVVYASKPISR